MPKRKSTRGQGVADVAVREIFRMPLQDCLDFALQHPAYDAALRRNLEAARQTLVKSGDMDEAASLVAMKEAWFYGIGAGRQAIQAEALRRLSPQALGAMTKRRNLWSSGV
jgi:hypothetical protein